TSPSRGDKVPGTPLRQGVAVTLRAFGRPRRANCAPLRQRGALWPALIMTGVAFALLALALWFVDAAATGQAGTLPRSVVDFFGRITNFGQSGWILIPLAAVLLIILLRGVFETQVFERGVLLAFAMRLSFLFAAVAIPGIVV